MAYGWYVAQAARRLREGAKMADVAAWLEATFEKVEISLGAFSLRFIRKSGRISAAAAFAGGLLGLRPVISLNQGVSEVQNKVRGDAALAPALLAWADGRVGDAREYLVGGTDDGAIATLAALCAEKWGRPPLATFHLGAAVATNTGPDALAIAYLAK
jgi:DegV family protein with EDD domain